MKVKILALLCSSAKLFMKLFTALLELFLLYLCLKVDNSLCHDGGPYHIETSSLICYAKQRLVSI